MNLTTISPDFIFGVIIPLLVIAMALAFVRLYRGPHLLDRVIALDLMIVVGIGIISAHAIATRTTALLDIALIFGALLMLIAAIGVVRMPDLLLRSSAASKATTLGAAALLLATAFAFADMGITGRMLAVIAFLFVTTPVATHMLARAATRCGVVLWQGTVNELPTVDKPTLKVSS